MNAPRRNGPAAVAVKESSVLRRIILDVWSILISLGLLFVGLQAYLMSDVRLLLIPTVVLPVATFLGLRAFTNAVRRDRIVARVTLLVIAAAHLLPSIHMLAGGFAPTVDGVITAIVAFLLVIAA